MRSSAALNVLPEMEITITVTMTVREMDHVIKELREIQGWPVGSLKSVISDALYAARQHFDATHEDRK